MPIGNICCLYQPFLPSKSLLCFEVILLGLDFPFVLRTPASREHTVFRQAGTSKVETRYVSPLALDDFF